MWEPEERRPRVALEKHGVVCCLASTTPPPNPLKTSNEGSADKGASVMENDLQCLSGRRERAIVKVKN